MKNSFRKCLSGVLALVLILSSFSAMATVTGVTGAWPDGTATEYQTTYSRNNDKTYVDRGAASAIQTAPEENLFTVGGKTYNLLDSDADGNYFVMTNFGGGQYTQTGFCAADASTYADMRFNYGNTASAAYTLQSLLGTYVPSADMQAEVLETKWYDEHDPSDCTNYTTCKLAFPSMTEIVKYTDEINYTLASLPNNYGFIPTRSIVYRRDTEKYVTISIINYGNGRYQIADCSTNRKSGTPNAPVVFFLDDDFFKSVAVDLATAGENVVAEIKKYSKEELASIYTQNELIALGYEFGDDLSGEVPTSYRTAISGLNQASGMRDKDGVVIGDTHAKYNNTSDEYTFTSGGKDFVVLGKDEAGDIFVTYKTVLYETDISLWTAKTSTTLTDYVFRVNNTNSAAATLNSDAWINANIPTDMQGQLKEKVWWTEHDVAAYENIDLWRTTAKIALPSYTEVKQYSDRFPFGKVPGNAREWLRTFMALDNSAPNAIGLIDEGSKIRSSSINHSASRYRPVFYLDKDFFKNVNVGVANIGTALKAEIVDTYEIADLMDKYSKADLVALGYDEAEVNMAADRVLTSTYPTVDSYTSARTTKAVAAIDHMAPTPAENILTLDEKELIYLDTDTDGNMFVMVNSFYVPDQDGMAAYPSTETEDANKIYNPSATGNIAAAVNSDDYITAVVPESVVNGYLLNKNWYVETNYTTPYYVTAKVVLPSAKEIETYYAKIGGWNNITQNNSYTRTPYFDNGSITGYYAITINDQVEKNLRFNAPHNTASQKQRPVFFIDKNYFIDEVVDPANMGANVKQFMRASFTRADLKAAGYSDAQLAAIGFATAASAENITIDAPAFAVGQTLQGDYDYVADATGAGEVVANTLTKWYRSADGVSYTAISGATGLTYTLTQADLNCYIKFGVQPANIDLVSETVYYSNATTKISEPVNFLFTNAKLVDADGNDVVSLNGETSVTAKVTIENLAEAEDKAIILAVYDDKNTLKAINTPIEQNVTAGTDEYTATVSGFTGAAGWYAKLMVWDNAENMKPLFGKTF